MYRIDRHKDIWFVELGLGIVPRHLDPTLHGFPREVSTLPLRREENYEPPPGTVHYTCEWCEEEGVWKYTPHVVPQPEAV